MVPDDTVDLHKKMVTMQYSSPQSYCLFMLISYPHGPHKHNMVNHIGHIICILYLYIYIYIYHIVPGLLLHPIWGHKWYNPHGISIYPILFRPGDGERASTWGHCDAGCGGGRWQMDWMWLWDMATAKDPTSIYLYIYMHMQWSIIRQCWLAYCSTCSVFVRTIFVAIFMNVYQQFGVGLGCRCCRNEWLFSVCTSRLRIEFQASLNFVWQQIPIGICFATH